MYSILYLVYIVFWPHNSKGLNNCPDEFQTCNIRKHANAHDLTAVVNTLLREFLETAIHDLYGVVMAVLRGSEASVTDLGDINPLAWVEADRLELQSAYAVHFDAKRGERRSRLWSEPANTLAVDGNLS